MTKQPMFNAPRLIIAMIFIFCAIHFWLWVESAETRQEMLMLFAFYVQRFSLASDALPFTPLFQVLSFVSHSFLHSDLTHLGMNMLWFLIFGTPLARRWSGVNFIIFYLLCAIAGAVLFYLLRETGAMIGASGAISGLMAASMRFMFSNGTALNLRQMVCERFIQSYFIFWLLTNVFLAMMMNNVAWEAHLGGFIAGVLLFPLFERVKS